MQHTIGKLPVRLAYSAHGTITYRKIRIWVSPWLAALLHRPPLAVMILPHALGSCASQRHANRHDQGASQILLRVLGLRRPPGAGNASARAGLFLGREGAVWIGCWTDALCLACVLSYHQRAPAASQEMEPVPIDSHSTGARATELTSKSRPQAMSAPR